MLDYQESPSLAQLGELWSQLKSGSSPIIEEFLEQLCIQLKEGRLSRSDQLVALLDQALLRVGGDFEQTYQIFTSTDRGTTRNHNEDACYPPSARLVNSTRDQNTLAIVCDGIGGHEGGEIASQLAIDAMREGVENLSFSSDTSTPDQITQSLEQFTSAANDLISQRNDSEKRRDRQRMGTTMVMTLAHAHEMYITSVGDSRVYWITPTGCEQVIVDDDVASREVRLGYTLYRNAIQYPSSGALVQALGMSSSATLHPTVQRLVLDEDCVFLLCSDGLSDYDRVEQYWETEILPILDHQVDIATAVERLIEIANRQNGHDNITVALVYCQVKQINGAEDTVLSFPQLESLPTEAAEISSSAMKTQQLPNESSRARPWGIIICWGCIILARFRRAAIILVISPSSQAKSLQF